MPLMKKLVNIDEARLFPILHFINLWSPLPY